MVGPGKHLIDPAVSVRQSPSEDRPEWRLRRDGAQDIADSFRNDRVPLRHGRRQLRIVDVKLGHDDIETPRAEFIDTLCKTVGVDLQFTMQVSLQANSMKRHPFVEQIGNEITQAGAPCSQNARQPTFGIVIIQGKLNVRICIGDQGGKPFEYDCRRAGFCHSEFLPAPSDQHRKFGNGLVHHIPGSQLSPIIGDHCGDMIAKQRLAPAASLDLLGPIA